MVSLSAGFAAFIIGTALTLALPVVAFWLIYKVIALLAFLIGGGARIVGRIVRRVGRFARGVVVDSLHLAGGLVTAGVIFPLSVANVAIGRLAAARHYGRALEDELTGALLSLYRIGLGHPARLLGLGALTEGLERRLPDLIARAPRTGPAIARPRGKAAFAGYTVHGELPPGGSGARLFLARPSEAKLAELRARGHAGPGQVVIKAFDRVYGSTLPQIVRESRALEAAKRLGVVLEHELTDEHFHYVMPYVPGDDLDVVTRRLHAVAGQSGVESERGLDRRALAKVVGYASDLCATLERFHAEGLWHKDIKPSNLLVSADRLHVVDLGLVTPLASAMTLTTHGTEYFRDPELVRMAIRGAKVQDVDGVKFDIYSAGAVLYSMLENSFPAHGSLSRLAKPAPEALAWIVRRAMCDISQRYPSARAMWRDLQAVQAARDPFSVRPADLPSVRGGSSPFDERAPEPKAAVASSLPREDAFAGLPPAAEPAGRLSRRAERRAARAARKSARASLATTSGVGRERRRVRRGVVGAFCVTAMFVCIAGGALTAVAHEGGFGRDGYVALERIGGLLHAGRGYAYDEGAPVVNERFASAAHAAATVPDAPRPPRRGGRGNVLLFVHPGVADPSASEQFAAQVRALGYRIVGLANTEADIDWTAAAQREVAGAPFGDEGALQRLERWTARQPHLSAVLWLGAGSQPGAVAGRLVAPRSAAAGSAISSSVRVLASDACSGDAIAETSAVPCAPDGR